MKRWKGNILVHPLLIAGFSACSWASEMPVLDSMAEHVSPLTTIYIIVHPPPLGVDPADVVVEVGPEDMGVEAGLEDVGVEVGPEDVGVEVGPEDLGVEVGPEDVGVEVGPEVAVEEKTGVPVSHAMEPPQASPGSGVPLHVQDDYRRRLGR
jgi:hypothetical protein